MEDGDGIATPSRSDIAEDENSQVFDSEDSQLSKQTSVREHSFNNSEKSFTDTNTFRGFVSFSNINGDCTEKNASVPERVLASSSTNSLSSIYSETTRDSVHDESSRHNDDDDDDDSGSENESKSSSSEASARENNFSLPKSEDSHHISSELSDTSSDSEESSGSEDSFAEKDDGDFIDNKLDDNSTLNASPTHSNDSEKEPSSETDNYKEPKDFKPNDEAMISPELCVDNLSSECPETQNSTSSLSVHASDPKAENTTETVHDDQNQHTSLLSVHAGDPKAENTTETIDNDQKQHPISENNEQKISTDNILDAKSIILGPPDSDAKLSECINQEKLPEHNIGNSSNASLEESMEIENEVSKSSVDDKPPILQDAEIEPKIVKQEVSDTATKDDIGEVNVNERERVARSIEKKTDERVVINELGEQFLIQYKGFKKTRTISGVKANNKSLLKSNPFNPAWKRNSKSRFGVFRNFRDEIDCSTLQPEYAQYLGLQPIVKFKCSNCGMSTFQTMSALNTHQVECKKNGKLITCNSEISPPPDINSANIKLTRKVFLCSTCGTYYENCDLFLHMREFHRRYICLFCLFMAQSPEVLQEHLKDKHNIFNQTYMSLDELQKHSPQTFFLLCLRCDRVFTEMDDSVNHKCTSKNIADVDHSLFKKPRTDISFQDLSSDMCNFSTSDACKTKIPPKMSKEVNINKSNSSLHEGNEICFTEDENKESQSDDFTEQPMDTDSEIINSKIESYNIALEAENLQLKFPSCIEIKPLVPGEKSNFERIESKKSSIEIIPLPTEPVKKKVKLIKKTKKIIKKTIKKKPSNMSKTKAVVEDTTQNVLAPLAESNKLEPQPEIVTPPLPPVPESIEKDPESPPVNKETEPDILPPVSAASSDVPEVKRSLSQEIFKIKLPCELDSDGESDDSQKLSLVVDENTNNSDTELRKSEGTPENGSSSPMDDQSKDNGKLDSNEITLAREDVAAMALTLDDKIENVPIQAVVKECVRTSCLSCNYCRHACKIAVNGKQLALHLLSEHRYTPVKNETHDDVVRKLLNSLEILDNMYFNTETYDSSDPTIHIPYDQEKNYDCFQCSYYSSSHKDLYAHKRKCHTKSLLLCIMCKSNFYSYSELICHLCPGSYNAKVQFHNVDLIFRCCFCRLDTIPSAFRLMVHLRKSHHTCDICLELCIDQQKLSTHMWKHKLNHLCYRCGIAYASKPDITKHLFWKHGTESVLCKKCLQKKWPHVYHFCIPPTSFICEECNISFSKAVALKVHKRIHGNDYPYSCEQCEKKFVSKKLLSRHLDRHNAIAQKKEKMLNSPHEDKEEIINVTDLNDNKECSQNETSDNNKEADGKDKGHKKHKKEREKKEKKVVDVYDLPPLNLSSESDSSDEEDSSKTLPSKEVKESSSLDVSSDTKFPQLLDDKLNSNSDMPKLDGIIEGNFHNSLPVLDDQIKSENSEDLSKKDLEKCDDSLEESSLKPRPSGVTSIDNIAVNTLLPLGKDQARNDEVDSTQNDHVEGIWENFYKTNPQNSKLPFPLCAMKSEVAYSIIMGDHDYCQPTRVGPVIKEDLPSTSNLIASLSDDKLEEVTPIIPENLPQTPPPLKEQEAPSTPTSMSKKKLKSPKKKMSKTPDDNNSSSSSDSSSDSDTSSCSCGTNCSCSSSSSNSSSSSSSDSDSSTNEDKSKQDKRKKRKDKRMKQKSESEIEVVKEAHQKQPELVLPEDPPIRESELETDETTSDEEFYDRQPQIIANQMLAEKRQMVLLATGTPVNNGNASPTIVPPPQEPVAAPPPLELLDTSKLKTKPKRKRKMAVTPKVPKAEKTQSLSDPYPKFVNEPKPYSPFQQVITTPKQKTQPSIPQSPSLPEAGGSGPETDSTRLSKRRRVRNKFYGYSSGEEEDTPKQAPKWRKLESHMPLVQTPKIQSNMATPTPRIQLTVPKQVIRKPTYHKASMKAKQQSSSESSDSGGSDIEDRIPRPTPAEEPIKADKDVYCYCRCPYDEVSEMIACDDANCKIEWFHFECVGILVPPRGQWFCPGCRKARGLPT